MRILSVSMLALASAFSTAAYAQDWKHDYKIVRFGLISSENQKDQMIRLEPLKAYLSKTLGVEFEFFTAANYDGTIQAMAANQIEFASFGSSSYAAAYQLTNGGVKPIGVQKDVNGSTGYFSVITTLCDGPYKTIEDLKGKTLAFADPDSTSGYAVPYYNLKQQGFDPEAHFAAIPFSGSHEAGVMGLVNGQFDAAATYYNSDVSGVVHNMEQKGMIEAGKVCAIWESPEITNSPIAVRTNIPEALITAVQDAFIAMPQADPVAWEAYATDDVAFVPVAHETYQWIIDMREWFRKERRG